MADAMLPCAFSADRVVIVVDREVSVIPSCLCTQHAYLPVRNCLSWTVVVFRLLTGYMVSSPNLCCEMLPFLPSTSRWSWLLISARIFRNTQEVMLALVFVYYGSILNPLRIVNFDSLKGWRRVKSLLVCASVSQCSWTYSLEACCNLRYWRILMLFVLLTFFVSARFMILTHEECLRVFVFVAFFLPFCSCLMMWRMGGRSSGERVAERGKTGFPVICYAYPVDVLQLVDSLG